MKAFILAAATLLTAASVADAQYVVPGRPVRPNPILPIRPPVVVSPYPIYPIVNPYPIVVQPPIIVRPPVYVYPYPIYPIVNPWTPWYYRNW
jgi:hypothetical protein